MCKFKFVWLLSILQCWFQYKEEQCEKKHGNWNQTTWLRHDRNKTLISTHLQKYNAQVIRSRRQWHKLYQVAFVLFSYSIHPPPFPPKLSIFPNGVIQYPYSELPSAQQSETAVPVFSKLLAFCLMQVSWLLQV